MADLNDIVYVVWGPTAEWSDGSGPLAYFAYRESAEQFIEDERKFLEEEGLDQVWPYTVVGWWIEEKTVGELVSDGALSTDEAKEPIEDIIMFLNE